MPGLASPKYRHRLPQLESRLFLADGGLETTLIYHEGWDLPIFQAFTLLESERGRAALRAYFDRYLPLAIEHGMGFEAADLTGAPGPAKKAAPRFYRPRRSQADPAPNKAHRPRLLVQ